jgi:hypothetical protein
LFAFALRRVVFVVVVCFGAAPRPLRFPAGLGVLVAEPLPRTGPLGRFGRLRLLGAFPRVVAPECGYELVPALGALGFVVPLAVDGEAELGITLGALRLEDGLERTGLG